MKNKEQVLVVPVNYISYLENGFTGASFINAINTYCLYDSTGVYKSRYEIDNNICFVKIAVVMLFKSNDKFLVKELYDLNKRPCIEIGINSYIKPYCGNYNAVYNQMEHILKNDLKIDPDSVKISFIGNIRDLTNESVKSVLGCIYYINTANTDTITSKSEIYQYKWYTLRELIDRYARGTSWTKMIVDCLLEKTIKIN